MAIAIEAVNLIPPPLSSPIATLPAFGRVDSVQSVNYVQSLPNVIKLINHWIRFKILKNIIELNQG